MGFSTTSTQPAVEVVEISDLTAANAGMELLQQEGMPLQSTPLRARRVIVRLASTVVIYHSTNLRVRTRTKVQDGWLGFAAIGPRSKGTVDGLRVRPGMIVVGEPGTQAGFVVDPGYESITLLVRPQVLRKHLAARQREDEFHWPRGIEVLGADPGMARALFRTGRILAAAAASRPTLFDEDRPERLAAESQLIEALLGAMRATDPIEASGTERTRQAYCRIVEIAESHVLSRVNERVQVSDLCRATDTSERTLECAFKEVTGLSPIAYLIRLRLHQVRASLLSAQPGSTRVSTAALRWGFWHFGEFSRAYKQCFGELPSETLRRRRVGSSRQPGATARH